MMRTRLLAAAALLVGAGLATPLAQQGPAQVPLAVSPFESYLELLRLQAGIPGLSAAIVQDGVVVWERGLGFQDVEARVRATPDTPYPIADLSQTVASVLLLECAEERRLSLDDPADRFRISLPENAATLRQILNHTSMAPPGEVFRYDADRYAQLAQVVEACVPQPYRKTVAVRILERLAMKDSVPGRDVLDPGVVLQNLFATSVQQRYAATLARMAQPYRVDKKGRSSRADLPAETLTAATGIVSTVRDLARFDAALGSATLLREDTLLAAWTAPIGRDRVALPMGLGWFVQRYDSEMIVWHFGSIPNAYSSLILKVPGKNLTLILLANSDGLSAAFDLRSGDVTKSLFALLFSACLPDHPVLRRGLRLLSVCAIVVLTVAPKAHADWQFAPLLGLTFKGSTNLALIAEQPETHWNVGGSVLLIGAGPLGVEGIFVLTPNFLEQGRVASDPPLTLPVIAPVSSSLVYSLMGNLVVAAPLNWNEYGLRPFLSGGLGLMHASQQTATPAAFPINSNLLGYNVGGGAIGFISDRVGVRFDLRYFSSLSRTDEAISFGPVQLRYWTGSIGLVLRY